MNWHIHCFAGIRGEIGAAEIDLELPDGAGVADLKRALESAWPALAGRLGSVRVAADYEFLGEADPLPPGAELALIPPVSGGAPAPGPGPDAWAREEAGLSVRLSGDPLSLDQALAAVRGPDAGALVTFVGTVRGLSRGQEVHSLEYEAYPGMALEWLARLARRARAEHGALRVALFHRVGRVPVGGDSVVIAVAAAHRAEAFAAGRALIEALKADVPIWKKERYAGGDVWVGWGS